MSFWCRWCSESGSLSRLRRQLSRSGSQGHGAIGEAKKASVTFLALPLGELDADRRPERASPPTNTKKHSDTMQLQKSDRIAVSVYPDSAVLTLSVSLRSPALPKGEPRKLHLNLGNRANPFTQDKTQAVWCCDPACQWLPSVGELASGARLRGFLTADAAVVGEPRA